MPAPMSPTTPLDVIDIHIRALRDIYDRLIKQNAQLQRDKTDLYTRLSDALDEVEKLQALGRGKDQIIEELQEMNRPRGSR